MTINSNSNIAEAIRSSPVDNTTGAQRKYDGWEAAFDRLLKKYKSAPSASSTSATAILGHIDDASEIASVKDPRLKNDRIITGAGVGLSGADLLAAKFPGVAPPAVLSTETIMSLLATLGRPYFRFRKPRNTLRFRDIQFSFHGKKHIDLLVMDDLYFYCCLKSESLTREHSLEPIRHIRNGDMVRLELCQAPDPLLTSLAEQESAVACWCW
ncbi:hypothetical protein CF319_g9213 [Tilletia indica]|nr:hypothetical protein CF319_g9213 [Tilletia indica]